LKGNNEKILKMAASNAFKSISKQNTDFGGDGGVDKDSRRPPLPTDGSIKFSTVTVTPTNN